MIHPRLAMTGIKFFLPFLCGLLVTASFAQAEDGGPAPPSALALATGSMANVVEQCGVKYDGSDQSDALQACQDRLTPQGIALYFPPTVTAPGGAVRGCFEIDSHAGIVGTGDPLSTILKAPDGKNCTPVSTRHFPELWQSGRQGGSGNVFIYGITLDGDYPVNRSGDSLDLYGWHYIVENTFLIHAPDDNLKTDYADTEALGGMEGRLINVTADSAGCHNVLFGGPHDSQWDNVILIDPSLAAYGTCDNLHMIKSNLSATQLHTWSRHSTGRYALNDDSEGGYNNSFSNSWFEGGILGTVRSSANNTIFTGVRLSNSNAQASMPPLLLLGAGQSFDGQISCTSQTKSPAIQLGDETHHGFQNTVRAQIINCPVGAVDFTYDTGQNNIELNLYNGGIYPHPYIGQPAKTSLFIILTDRGVVRYPAPVTGRPLAE